MSNQDSDASTQQPSRPWLSPGVEADRSFPAVAKPSLTPKTPKTMIEEPIMRAVAFGSAPWQDEPKLRLAQVPLPPKMILREQRKLKSADGIETKINVNKSQCIPSSNWKVLDEDLEEVPEHFILERTSRVINDTSATIISTRIADCLRNRSVEVKFSGKKAKAKCKNRDFVKYSIILFRGESDEEFEDSNTVIVELQRRSGSSISFMNDCRAILAAAEGEDSEELRIRDNLTVPSSLKSVASLPPLPPQKLSMDPTKLASELLAKENIASKILATEMLCLDTDDTKTDPKVALAIAKQILNVNSPIFKSMTCTLQAKRQFETDDESDSLEKLYFLTLSLLSNALKVTDDSGMASHIIQDCDWYNDKLVPILIELLKHSHARTQDALIAAKVFYNLLGASQDVKRKAEEVGADLVLAHVHEFAQHQHLALAKESQRCKILMECH